MKFPPADERTFLKGRDESEIVNVDKIVGQSFSLGKVKTEGNLNQRNQKIIDDKINAMGLVQVPQDKDLHNGDVFFCKICECVLKDNAAYIEHLNGKKRKCFNYIDFFTLFIFNYDMNNNYQEYFPKFNFSCIFAKNLVLCKNLKHAGKFNIIGSCFFLF